MNTLAYQPARYIVFFLACASVVSSARAQNAETRFYELPGSPVTGGRLFMDKGCIKCHAIHGLGGAGGPDLGKVQVAWTFLDIAGVLWNHQPKMESEFKRLKIARSKLTSDEMFDIIAFVYFLNYFGKPGDSTQGELVFLRKRCVECHAIGSHGPPKGIPLDRFQSHRSPAFFAAALWNASKDMTEMMKAEGIPRPVYEADDIVDLLAFIRREADPREYVDPVYLPPGSSKAGEILFKEKGCIRCHSVGETREGKKGPVLGSWEFRGVLPKMVGNMWNHGPGMWESMKDADIAIPELTEGEMSDLMTYLYFSSFIDPPGNTARGADLFKEKRCLTCHEPDMGKELLGTDVTKMELVSTPAIIAAMWNHASEMNEAIRSSNIAWPQFRPTEMADVVAFIKSRSENATKE